MELNDAQSLNHRLIETQEVHQDYERTVSLKTDYYIYRTGQNIGAKLLQFVMREDLALFQQRLRMTKSITPAVAASLEVAFNKVIRNDRIRKGLKLQNPQHVPVVEKMESRFYGSSRKKNRGLDYWMKTRFKELTFSDPNAWVVTEWDAPVSESDIIIPRPFEVGCENARNFYIENETVKWLFVRQPINFKVKNSKSLSAAPFSNLGMPIQTDQPMQPMTGVLIAPRIVKDFTKPGYRYTLYDEDYTIVSEQIDIEYFRENPITLDPSYQELIKIKDDYFIRSYYTPKLGFPPCDRVGYVPDKVTNDRTFVNPWHNALCYFEKTLKTVSEMDLTMALHVFPQKIQYVQKCAGMPKKKCNAGYLSDGAMCTVCSGNGYKLHTTAQDSMLLPLPDQPRQEDIINLDQLLVYKAPPIETVRFQNEYILQLERQSHQAVYNSQVFIRKNTSTSIVGDGQQTATENDNNMQSVYDTLEPYTEKYSEMRCGFVITFSVIAGANIDDIDCFYIFPADYKLKTSDILLNERRAASTSGAPAFLLETIDDDLAAVTYIGDPNSMQKYRVKRRFFPFSGKTPDEITQAVASQYVPEETKVLYMNFESIFKEIEQARPDFYLMANWEEQRVLIAEKVSEFMERVKSGQPTFDIEAFRNAAPGAGREGEPSPEDADESEYGAGDDNPGPGTQTDEDAITGDQ